MTKRLFKVTILFCFIIACFAFPSFAVNSDDVTVYYYDSPDTSLIGGPHDNITYATYSTSYYNVFKISDDVNAYAFSVGTTYKRIYFVVPIDEFYYSQTSNYIFGRWTARSGEAIAKRMLSSDSTYNLAYYRSYDDFGSAYTLNIKNFDSLEAGLSYVRDFINNPPSNYTKNPNVDEFIANTLISMGIRYSQYSDALSIASSAWNYIIDENNWYIGSGDRNDKDIVWDIDNAVSYLNAQSNNYLDWYNGYKVNKDLTIALTKFISDNYIVSTLGQGTLAGYNVYYNGSYSYGTVGGTSGSGGTFGSSPNALSFYPASTITYFNGAYLHDNNVIDQDEFVYSPADVRKFIGYPSSAGIIEPPDSNNGTGVITDGNGDTVYNIDLDFPSFDWLADAIQAVLDFLDRLISTIADFLTQILDAILSLFSDAFESLTEFGEGIIEWLYAIIAGFSTIGSNYIPASLWAVILPFILINIGVGLIMFVMRSH